MNKAFAASIERRRAIILSELGSMRRNVAGLIQQAKAKTLAERREAVTVDDVDANPAEFFGVLVGKGLNSNRTSL